VEVERERRLSESVEIEFKNLLTREEYDHIIEHFQVKSTQKKRQVNHYFDTPTFSLKEINVALRVREKAECFEITMKQPAIIGLLETNQKIDQEEAQELLQNGILPNGEIKNKLCNLAISVQNIVYFGSLTTDRVELDYQGGTLVLDHSSFLGVEDFEIEYEVIDPAAGEIIFLQLLAKLKIPVRKTENKVQRFYNHKYEQN
jgi:uncharacterized protein YjbK